MAKEIETEPTPRIPLSKNRVLQAAVALADEEGIEALSMRKLADSWASSLQVRRVPGPGRLRYSDALLGFFRDSGFSKELTYHAYHIIESYVIGFTVQVLGYRNVDMEQFEDIAATFMRGEFLEEYPHFSEHVRQHMEPDPGQDDVNAYELGLDVLLDGLERLRDRGSAA